MTQIPPLGTFCGSFRDTNGPGDPVVPWGDTNPTFVDVLRTLWDTKGLEHPNILWGNVNPTFGDTLKSSWGHQGALGTPISHGVTQIPPFGDTLGDTKGPGDPVIPWGDTNPPFGDVLKAL